MMDDIKVPQIIVNIKVCYRQKDINILKDTTRLKIPAVQKILMNMKRRFISKYISRLRISK